MKIPLTDWTVAGSWPFTVMQGASVETGAKFSAVTPRSIEDIEAFMGTKVFLQTWVKVKENWRDSQAQLRNFGFTD